MNKENILALADLIEGLPPEKFNMRHFIHGCGTPACIAGWAAWLHADKPESLTDDKWNIEKMAALYIGFGSSESEDEERDSLFYLCNSFLDYKEVSNEKAANALRHLAATGKVDWSIQ